jgi:hypothetical protein
MRTRILATLAALTLLAACDRTEPQPEAADGIRSGALQYASCMRERGYDVPDPTFNDEGLPVFDGPREVGKKQDFQRDHQECRAALNRAYEAAGVRGKQTASADQLLAFTRCIREQGLPMPDPEAGELTVDKQVLNSPAWPAAADACKHHLPPEFANIGKPKATP